LLAAACVVMALPFVAALAWVEGVQATLAAGASVSLAVLATVHFLFPPRHGVRRDAPGRLSIEPAYRVLAPGIRLHEEHVAIPAARCAELDLLVLSDLHCNSQQRLDLIRLVLSRLASAGYDAVLTLGDLGEKADLLPPLIEAIAGLRPRYGVFLVRGNHDFGGGRSAVVEACAQANQVTILSNSTCRIPEQDVVLVGLECPWRRSPLVPPVWGPAIGLSHAPDNIGTFRDLGCGLVLAGHTHGGFVRAPGLGPVLVPSRYGRLLDRGWFRLGGTFMYVTAGVGYFPGLFGGPGEVLNLRVRFGPDDGESARNSAYGLKS
jgi:hypothetical protein